MSWTKSLQLLDLDQGQVLELHCNACGHVRKIRNPHQMTHPVTGKDISHLFLDELERKARCAKTRTRALAGRHCGGTVRLLLTGPDHRPQPFIAGMCSETFDREAIWKRERLRLARERTARRRGTG